MDYKPPFDITLEILNLVASISEKLGKMSLAPSLDSRPHLRRNNRIRSVHSSLRIEANSLSLDEVRGVINGRPVIGKQKEIQEVLNAYAAYEKLETLNPYNLEELLETHGIMTQGTVKESGRFRSGAEGVYAEGKCIFIAPPAEMIPPLMKDLFHWMQDNRKTLHPLILSSVFHYEFVYIHPFADGNGRMARLWHTALLYQWNSLFGYIPLEIQIEKYQSQYYEAIGRSNSEGKSTSFIEFMLKMIDAILDDVSKEMSSDNLEVSEYVRNLLKVMDLEVPYPTKTLLEKLNLRSKETLRKNYLDPAIRLGLVEMTIPEKPTSRNQRYRKIRF